MFQPLTYLWFPKRDEGDSPKAATAAAAPVQSASLATSINEPEPPTELVETLLKAIEERTSRAEKSVLRSMAEQTGVDEASLADLLAKARTEQAAELPPETQEKLDAANARLTKRLLEAEVKAIGAELGLIDADVALTLLDTTGVTIAEDGAVSGVREALEALRQRKRYLFTAGSRSAWAQKVGTGGASALSGVEEAFYRKNPTLKK